MKQHAIIPSSVALLVLSALLLLSPMLANAQVAYNEVTLGTGGNMVFSVNGIAIHVVSGGTVASTSVDASTLTLVLAPPGLITIKAPDLNTMAVEYASGSTDYTIDSVCNGTLSQKDIAIGSATTTFTITPDAGLCATNNGGGGGGGDTPAPASSGGGGGGGGGGTTPASTPVVTTPAITPAPAASSGNAALIATLQAQLQALLAQIAVLTGGSAGANASANAIFNRDLQTGSTGADVTALQVWLNTHGYLVASSGAGSPGNETTKFGALTRAALIKLQKAAGITPTAGYFGPKTRAYIAANP